MSLSPLLAVNKLFLIHLYRY